jgi:N-acetylglucosamine-6-sulfatase
MRYPLLIKAGTTLDPFVLSIDLAPTFLDVAGVAIPKSMHGQSLLPLIEGKVKSLRQSFLIEYFSDTVFPRVLKMGYQAVRTDRWKYIHYTDLEGMDELYDLETDPYEMKNRLQDPAAQEALKELEIKLKHHLKDTE